jgi:hypothetical protein
MQGCSLLRRVEKQFTPRCFGVLHCTHNKMVRLLRDLLVLVLALSVCVVVSAVQVEEENFPLSTLLEHTAIASGQWAPTPRNRLEKLQIAQSPRAAEFLGARNEQVLFQGSDSRGHTQDSEGNKRENRDRSREPQSNHFGDVTAKGPASNPETPNASTKRAPRGTCKGKDCAGGEDNGPVSHGPSFVPPVPKPLPPKKETPVNPEHLPFPEPPPPENPLPTPAMPDCGGLCNPSDKDPLLTRIPQPPLNDMDIATVGLEGSVLAKVMQKLKNREGWLRAQKLWLSKAVEAAATVRREIELAEFTKDAVASDLEQLKIAQDALSIKYKADRLKWSFKDKKMTLEALTERLEALEHAKADVATQIREAKDEVIILENTLGPPSQQVQITPNELEDPLKFLDDVMQEHNYNDYLA